MKSSQAALIQRRSLPIFSMAELVILSLPHELDLRVTQRGEDWTDGRWSGRDWGNYL
jgi:hypothetical protein